MNKQHSVAIEITAQGSQLRRGLRQSANDLRAFERQVGGVANRLKAVRQQLRGSGVMGRGGGMVKGALGMAGIFGFQQLLTDTKNFEQALVRLAQNSGKMNTGFLNRSRKAIIDVSNQYGIAKEEVLSYSAAVVAETGSSKLAMSTMKQMGAVAAGTGAKMGDLAQIAVNLSTKLGVSSDSFSEMMDVFATQADKGSFELKDLAGNMAKVLTTAQQVGVRGTGGARTVGALMQFAKRGNATGAEAATSAERFMDHLLRNQVKIEKIYGVNLKKGGKWKDLAVIFRELSEAHVAMEKSGKKVKKRGLGNVPIGAMAGELFGVFGQRTFLQGVAQARAGWGNKVGGLESFGALRNVRAGGAIQSKADFYLKSPAGQWNKAMESMKNAMYKHMLPVLQKAVALMPQFASALKFILNHSETLIKLWLGWKGAKFFAGLTRAALGSRGAMVSGAGGYGAGVAFPAAIGAGAGAGGVASTGGIAGRRPGGGMLNGVPMYTVRGYRDNSPFRGAYTRGGVMIGSDLDLLRREQYRKGRWGRAGRFAGRVGRMGAPMLNALPLAPAAVGFGESLGEWLAGDSIANMRKRGLQNLDQEILNKRNQQKYFERRSNQRLLRRTSHYQYLGSTSGALLKQKTEKALAGVTGTTYTAGGREKFDVDLPSLISGKTRSQSIRKLRGLQSLYEEHRQLTIGNLKRKGYTGPLTNEALEKQNQPLARLGDITRKLDETLAKLINRGIKVNISNVPSTPGDRVESTNGKYDIQRH